MNETWHYEGKKNYWSDRFSGYAIFASNDNADRAGSLAFAHSLCQGLQKGGLYYTPHYAFSVREAIPPRTVARAGSSWTGTKSLNSLLRNPQDCGKGGHRRGGGFLCEPRPNGGRSACG